MRDYQLTKSEFALPHETYMRTLWTIRDYPRLLLEADSCLERTPDPTETPEIQRQRDLHATERQNLRYAELMKTIRAIESAMIESVPEGDRKAVIEHICNRKSWPIDKSQRTYKRRMQAFIHCAAQKLNYI